MPGKDNQLCPSDTEGQQQGERERGERGLRFRRGYILEDLICRSSCRVYPRGKVLAQGDRALNPQAGELSDLPQARSPGVVFPGCRLMVN